MGKVSLPIMKWMYFIHHPESVASQVRKGQLNITAEPPERHRTLLCLNKDVVISPQLHVSVSSPCRGRGGGGGVYSSFIFFWPHHSTCGILVP